METAQRNIKMDEIPELGEQIGLEEAKRLACAVIERVAEDYKKMSFEGRDRLAKKMIDNFWWNLLDYDCTFREMMLRWEKSVGDDKRRMEWLKKKDEERHLEMLKENDLRRREEYGKSGRMERTYKKQNEKAKERYYRRKEKQNENE